jgi:hypothetical protein
MSTSSLSHPRLRVVAGPFTGATFGVGEGRSVIGRDASAAVRLADAEVSRQHAVLDRSGDRVTLTDLGSANGTFVNGHPLRGSSHDLRPGDLIHLGQIQLVYEMDRDQGGGGGAPTGRVRMGRVVLVAGGIALLGWLVPALFTLIADEDVGLPAWLLAPGAAVLTGVAQSVFEATMRRAPPETDPTRPAARRASGVPAGVAILIVLLVIGVGGYAATVGIRYGVGWITGNEDQVGRERLASSPAPSGASGRVRATVTSIVNTAHFTRVALTVSNQEDKPATITLFENCSLTGGGVTLQPDSFRSKWVQTVPPRSDQSGHLTFPGHLPDSATTAQFSINMVFVFGRFGEDDSLVIRSIRIRAP